MTFEITVMRNRQRWYPVFIDGCGELPLLWGPGFFLTKEDAEADAKQWSEEIGIQYREPR